MWTHITKLLNMSLVDFHSPEEINHDFSGPGALPVFCFVFFKVHSKKARQDDTNLIMGTG